MICQPTSLTVFQLLIFIFTLPNFQYHALGLLYHIRKSDKLAVTKLVSKFTKHSLKSPYAYCLLIRIACKLLEEEDAG